MNNSLSYREKRREGSVKRFLNGEARQPYVLREDIASGLKNRTNRSIGGENEIINEHRRNKVSPPCTCQEALGQFADMFIK